MRYTVTARRWTRGWELHIVDEAGDLVGVTQVRTLAKRMKGPKGKKKVPFAPPGMRGMGGFRFGG